MFYSTQEHAIFILKIRSPPDTTTPTDSDPLPHPTPWRFDPRACSARKSGYGPVTLLSIPLP